MNNRTLKPGTQAAEEAGTEESNVAPTGGKAGTEGGKVGTDGPKKPGTRGEGITKGSAEQTTRRVMNLTLQVIAGMQRLL